MYNTRIVRDGNHFVRLANSHDHGRWLLIDGPWFDHLERLSMSYHGRVWSVQTRYYEPSFIAPVSGCGHPLDAEVRTQLLTWERVMWHNGSSISERKAVQVTGSSGTAVRWYEHVNKRAKPGWWLPHEGYRLPAHLGHVDFIDDWFVAKMQPESWLRRVPA